MPTWADVRSWDPARVGGVADALNAACTLLAGLNDEVSTAATPAGWHGAAAEAAKENLNARVDGMERLVASLAAVRRAAHEGEIAITAIQHAIAEAEGLARAQGFAVGAGGTIEDVAPPDVPPDQADEVGRERERVKAELVDRVEQILRRAEDVDNDIADLLGKVMHGEIDAGDATTLAQAADAGAAVGGLTIVGPPPGGSPGDNAGWWAALSPVAREQILKDHPEWIGNLDGIPFKDRDRANKARFDAEYAKLKQLEAQLQAELDANVFGGLLSNADAGLAHVQDKLHAMDKIRDVAWRPDRHLLTLDLSNERAEAAVAIGDVDTADHVSVFTPGMTTTVEGDLDTYDNEMRDLQRVTQKQLLSAGRGNETVAMVTWIGYQAPQISDTLVGENSVTDSYAAENGANKLAPFLNGIDAARGLDPTTGQDRNPHLTALGHSYGSTTTGIALQKGTGVDEAVFFGSPGLGTRDVENLKVPDGHAYYIEGRLDGVGDLGQFGPDPSRMDGMQQLSAKEAMGPNGPMLESAWHSYYLQDNSTSQYNMAAAIGGLPNNMIHDN